MKVNKKAFRKILLFMIGFTFLFAILDIIGFKMWGQIGGFGGDAYLAVMPTYMLQFWTFAYLTIAVAAGIYYYLTKDGSEAIAIVTAGVMAVWSGLEDIFFYIMRGIPLDASMPWLMGTPVGTVAHAMGQVTVTPITLFLNIILFLGIGYIITDWLYKQKW